MEHSVTRHVCYADADHASVHTFSGKRYRVDLLRLISTCGQLQYNDIPCGHAAAVIQRYRPPPTIPQRNAWDYIHCPQHHSCCYDRLVHTSHASRRYRWITSASTARAVGALPPLFRKPKGRPQTVSISAGEQRARRARAGLLPDLRTHIQRFSRCREEGHNVLNVVLYLRGCSCCAIRVTLRDISRLRCVARFVGKDVLVGERVGVGMNEGFGEGTGRQVAWARVRASGEGTGRQVYRQLCFFLGGPFFSLYTKIYHTVSLEPMKWFPS